MKESDWYGLYSGSWKKQITEESFGHPAKFARGLIGRIYDHALRRGYIKPGDTILDPFGGVGLGAVDALRYGIHWRAVELEQPFVDLGAGCDCTGISPSDWARFYGRWKTARYLDGRHWCPRCIGEAGVTLDEPPTPHVSQAQAVRRARIAELSEKHGLRIPKYGPLPLPDDGYVRRPRQLTIFDKDSPSYERNNGRIPRTGPHHYTGNLELFARRYARDGATAALVQGDSRELGKVLGGAGAVVSSPPFGKAQSGGGIAITGTPKTGRHSRTGGYRRDMQGSASGQLGNLPATGDQFNAAIGSPPYAGQTVHGGGGIDAEKVERAGGRNSQVSAMDSYGDAPGQIGGMPEGSHAAVIGSPPHAESLSSDDPDKRGGFFRGPKRRNDRALTAEYGRSRGQLGAMRVIISSPGYSGSELSTDRKFAEKVEQDQRGGSRLHLSAGCYESGGNVSGMQQADFWTAARQIMEQVAQVLAPGAVAIWVLGGFVRDWEYVDFPDQWRQLGEACGFETVEWIRAWLIEDRGAQYTLSGELEEQTVERKSFFRRLCESKGSPPVDFEVVLVQRRI